MTTSPVSPGSRGPPVDEKLDDVALVHDVVVARLRAFVRDAGELAAAVLVEDPGAERLLDRVARAVREHLRGGHDRLGREARIAALCRIRARES